MRFSARFAAFIFFMHRLRTKDVPTYTYQCKKCSHSFDVFHSITQDPKIKCTECGGAAKRLMGTGGGIIFKGSGFYETDYKKQSNGGPKSEAKSDSKSESKSDSNSGGGGEVKSAVDSTPKKAEAKSEKKATPKKD